MVQPEGDQRPENDEGFNVTESKAAVDANVAPSIRASPSSMPCGPTKTPPSVPTDTSTRCSPSRSTPTLFQDNVSTTNALSVSFHSSSHPADGPPVPSSGASTVAKRWPSSRRLTDHAPSLLVSERTVAWSKERAKGAPGPDQTTSSTTQVRVDQSTSSRPNSSSHPAQAARCSTRVVRPIHVPKPTSNRVNPAATHQRTRLQKEGAGEGVVGTEEVAMRCVGQFVGREDRRDARRSVILHLHGTDPSTPHFGH